MGIEFNPYLSLLAEGCETDNHESDLYVEETADSLEIVRRSGWPFTRFTCQRTGRPWLDLPFAYVPHYEGLTAVGYTRAAAKNLTKRPDDRF